MRARFLDTIESGRRSRVPDPRHGRKGLGWKGRWGVSEQRGVAEQRLYRVPERRERAGMLLERFGLWRVRNERAGSFSRGMLQRLALCRALLHEPELLLFDEPYSALDEEGAALLDRQLAEIRPQGTFLVATHDPARLEPLATSRLAFA